jgi:queuine tRNA-ribosyltransferase
MNALHLHLRPGKDTVEQFGGVHPFTTWQGAILTDSGGYQFFSLKGLYSIDDDGVDFRSPYDGSSHHFTPESVIDLQVALGSDIAMPLDHCPPGDAPRDETVKASERTLKWLKRAVGRFRTIGPSSQSVFGIIQGGTDLELRREYTDRTVELNLDGYALGGISVGEDRALGDRVVSEITRLLPAEKPRYLMGVGLPGQVLDGIAAGIDMFDCVLPTRMARNGTLFTSQGRINITNAKYRTDESAIDPNCSCPSCERFSRAYLAHLYRSTEPGVLGVLSLHNLAYYLDLVRDARIAILADRFLEWKHEVEDGWAGEEAG